MLNLILVAMFLIVFRVWHLSVVQHEHFEDQSYRPQRRTFSEKAERGVIKDRFGVILAKNKIQYKAGVCFSHLQQIPRVQIKVVENNKRQRVFPRKDYISKLSYLLAKELNLDPARVEDLIYSQSAIFPQVMYVLKEDISEKVYYKLKFLEKDWPGLCVEKGPKRFYPQGSVGSDIVGYMGPISQEEYSKVAQELRGLSSYVQAFDEGSYPPLPDGFKSFSDAYSRYLELKERAYKIHDYVGKAGIEATYDNALRGFHGKREFLLDAKGNFLKELPGARPRTSGKELRLSLSFEMQKHAEELLVKSEELREKTCRGIDVLGRQYCHLKQPFIKGGAIVVLDPKNGDLIAMASYPRKQNDLLSSEVSNEERRKQILKTFETPEYINGIWEGRWPLEKEVFSQRQKKVITQQQWLTLDTYLEQVLPDFSFIKKPLKDFSVKRAVQLQRDFLTIFSASEEREGAGFINLLFPVASAQLVYESCKRKNDLDSLRLMYGKEPCLSIAYRNVQAELSGIPDNYEKLLFLDISRLIADESLFSDESLEVFGHLSLAEFKKVQDAYNRSLPQIKAKVKEVFSSVHFHLWRDEHQKEFLREKRQLEKGVRKYARPYIEYLDEELEKQFRDFWDENQLLYLKTFFSDEALNEEEASFIQKPIIHTLVECRSQEGIKENLAILKPYFKAKKQQQVGELLSSFASSETREKKLLGRYFGLRSMPGKQTLQDLSLAFYPKYGFGYGRSYAYQIPAVPGSIFKLVTSYAALLSHYSTEIETQPLKIKRALNTLEIIDNWEWKKKNKSRVLEVGRFLDGKPIPRIYKKGRVPKSQRKNIGRIDNFKALGSSSNPYFALLAQEVIQSPAAFLEYTSLFGYGEKTGVELPQEFPGRLPKDLEYNTTGLYSFSIGQHTFEATPLQTAVMMASLVNGGAVLKPRLVKEVSGGGLGLGEKSLFQEYTKESMGAFQLLGLSYLPLLETNGDSCCDRKTESTPVSVRRWMFMPSSVSAFLTEGMRHSVHCEHGTAKPLSPKTFQRFPQILSDYQEVAPFIAGKTSTSESIERVDMARKCNLYNQIWFGGVSFNKEVPSLDQVCQSGKPFVYHDKYGEPELVVIVYLRFGDYGREAAPLVGSLVKKWRELNRQTPS